MHQYENAVHLALDADDVDLALYDRAGSQRPTYPDNYVAAQAEAMRMVTEKVAAAGEAAMMLASGGSGAGVVAGYRRKVRANARRLQRR